MSWKLCLRTEIEARVGGICMQSQNLRWRQEAQKFKVNLDFMKVCV